MTNQLYSRLGTLFLLLFVFVSGQVLFNSERDENTLYWCTVNKEEQQKCEIIAEYLRNEATITLGGFLRRSETFRVECNETRNKDECMVLLDSNLADITTLDPGEVFTGGRYHSLIPILEEIYSSETGGRRSSMYSVAIIRKSLESRSLRDLRGKKACFAGVGTLAGFVIPVSKLMREGIMEIVDCNNHVKSTIEFFGPSCAVNSLSDKYNPIGDNSDKLCQLCGSDYPGVRCTSNDPYAGYEGAIQCLLDKGDVAFVKHSTAQEFFKLKELYEAAVEANLTLEMEREKKIEESLLPLTTTTSAPFGLDRSPFNPLNQNQGTPGFGPPRNQPFDRRGPPGSAPDLFRPTNTKTVKKFSIDDFKAAYELLCPDGSRRSLEEWGSCYWAEMPAHAVVTSSAKSPALRARYQKFFQGLQRTLGSIPTQQPPTVGQQPIGGQQFTPIGQPGGQQFTPIGQAGGQQFTPFGQQQFPQAGQQQFPPGGQQPGQPALVPLPEPPVNLFESVPRFGNRSNLLFQDLTIEFRVIPEADQSFQKYLGNSTQSISEIRACPVGRVTLCVTSDAELVKCIKMRTALNAQLLKPEMICHKGHSHVNCMQLIRNGDADVVVLDAGDIYTAGHHYGLVPVLSEIYNLGEPEYYAVAVAYQGDPDTDLTYLKGKHSCHSGIGHGAGWIIPMAYLLSSNRMRNYGCDSILAASQYFTKSCVPGALSNEYNYGQEHHNLCDLCHGTSYNYCSRNAAEDFYGYTGAFRCLIEGGGEVAFVKHTTVTEVTDQKRKETWARNTLSGDYELLCRDGTRAPVTDFARCNLGKVKANAIVVRGSNETETKAIINLFLYAQQLYGRKLEDDFNFAMFYSPEPFSDLIFQDAAQQLRVIPKDQRHYTTYLGRSFLRARALVDCRASVSRLFVNTILITWSLIISLVLCFQN